MGKKIVNLIIGITLIALMLQGVFHCGIYSESQIFMNKEQIIIHQPTNLNKDEFVKELLSFAKQENSDLMYERYDDKNNRMLYKTNQKEDFFHIYTETGSILLKENDIFSTRGNEGTKKIYGVHIPGKDIIIDNFTKISEFDLKSGRYWVKTDKIQELCCFLGEKNIEYDKIGGIYIEDENEIFGHLNVALYIFIGIALVMYAFSKMKDYAIKKIMGYSKIQVWCSEIYEMGTSIIVEILIIGTIFFFMLFVLYEAETGVMWLKIIFFDILRMLIVVIVCLAISSGYINIKCGVLHIKGKRNDILLEILISLIRVLVFAIITLILSSNIGKISFTYHMYQTTTDMKVKLKQYATVVENVSVENPEEDYKAYDKKFCDFYRILHEERDAIISDTHDVTGYEAYSSNPSILINDCYIDFNKNIYDIHGERITSKSLVEGKYNVLVPQGFKYDPVQSGLCRAANLSPEQINVIEYSCDSVFLSFDNEISPETRGYFQNPIAEVFDETMIFDDCYRAMMLETAFINGFYFRTESVDKAYDEILPVLKKCGLENLFFEAPSVRERLDDTLWEWESELIKNGFILFLYIIAWVVLLIYSAQMYFENHAKDMSVKLLQGYSLLEIIQIRLAVESLMLIAMIVVSLFEVVSLRISFLLLITEWICLYIFIKKLCERNIVGSMKGEF